MKDPNDGTRAELEEPAVTVLQSLGMWWRSREREEKKGRAAP